MFDVIKLVLPWALHLSSRRVGLFVYNVYCVHEVLSGSVLVAGADGGYDYMGWYTNGNGMNDWMNG